MNFTENQLSEFNANGYLTVKQLVRPAVCERMLSVTQQQLEAATPPLEYEADLAYPGAPLSREAAGGATIRRLRGAYHRHACFREWAEDRSQAAKLAQLLGERVCLSLAHHNCVMTKHPAFGSATGWHRDMRYWSFARPDLICVWLALGPETAADGGLKFIPGSHRLQIRPEQLDALDFLLPELPENRALFAEGRQMELEQGDVLFFHSGLFHAAGRNATATLKASLAFAYHGVGNPPLGGSRSAASGGILLK